MWSPVGQGGAVPGRIEEPVEKALAQLLRSAVLWHVRSEGRRKHPPLMHAGIPGATETAFPAAGPDPTDHPLRVEVVLAMLRRVGALPDPDDPPGPGTPAEAPLLWLTRTGDLDLQDVDAHWLAAVCAATGELDRPLHFVLVNRRAWRDPRTGVGRTWRRLRAHR